MWGKSLVLSTFRISGCGATAAVHSTDYSRSRRWALRLSRRPHSPNRAARLIRWIMLEASSRRAYLVSRGRPLQFAHVDVFAGVVHPSLHQLPITRSADQLISRSAPPQKTAVFPTRCLPEGRSQTLGTAGAGGSECCRAAWPRASPGAFGPGRRSRCSCVTRRRG